MSKFVALQPLLRLRGGCYRMLLSIIWVGRRDKKRLLDIDLPGSGDSGCVRNRLQLLTQLFWVTAALRNMRRLMRRVTKYWSEASMFIIIRYHKCIWGWWAKYGRSANV